LVIITQITAGLTVPFVTVLLDRTSILLAQRVSGYTSPKRTHLPTLFPPLTYPNPPLPPTSLQPTTFLHPITEQRQLSPHPHCLLRLTHPAFPSRNALLPFLLLPLPPPLLHLLLPYLGAPPLKSPNHGLLPHSIVPSEYQQY
jgi:hypothetical protein